MKTRRTFLKLLATSAAALAVPATARRTRAADTSRKAGSKKSKAAASATSLQKELDKQKHATAEALKVIRDYPLPPGSEMAFAFAPMKPRAARRPEASASREDGR